MSFFVAYDGDGSVHGRFYVRGATSEEALGHAKNALKGITVQVASLRFTPGPEPLHAPGTIVALYSAPEGWVTNIQLRCP